MKKSSKTKKIVIYALLIALQIVFVRFISVESGAVRLSLGFIPVAVAGMIFGPAGGATIAGVADILGMFIFSRGTVYFFPLTICECLYGIGFGLFLHNRDLSVIKLSACICLQFILINLILSTICLYFYFIIIAGTPKGFEAIFISRLGAAAFNLPMQAVGVNLIKKHLRPLEKLCF